MAGIIPLLQPAPPGDHMHRSLKAALLGIGVIFGLPLAAFLTWDLVAFRPHLPEIHRILAQAAPSERDPTAMTQRLIDANLRGHVWSHVGSRLFWRLEQQPGNNHGTRALWAIAVKLHFNRGERIALFAALAELDRRARQMYGRSLSALPDIDVARVLAMSYSPTYYASRPQRLERQAQRILREARGLP